MEYPVQNYQQTQQQAVNTTKVKLRTINVLSLGIISAIINAVIGLITGIISSLIFASIPISAETELLVPGLSTIISLGYLLIIIIPAISAVLGFISGIIGALIYNLSAKITGGLKMQYEEFY